ncbi:glycosyltransferase [Larkinella terrae]|uniref:Glycosyltransferase n=1 Tax=Larkinella terrae TaxID=2025311 RepID=A0A7K0ELL8_9BACT|nr:nucleotide disphospho-sugar-binding domain-containing protein [Larkinella terrae]MRS62750.1 glycosyltransferase [Larkinella terrae]
MNAKKILFATIPADGHFNPLTGIAKHLQELGHDVRWYTGGRYVTKAQKLGIPVYPFQAAKVVNQDTLEELFPERQRIKGTIARLRFDINEVFLNRAPEFVADVIDIYQEFPFELLICDALFTGAPILKQLLEIPVGTIGIVPLAESSRDLPPAGMGLEPATGFWGKSKQNIMRYLTQNVLLKPCTELYNRLLRQHGLVPTRDFVFDAFIREADVYLQSGVPGFEYNRRDMSPNVRFVGPLLPYTKGVRNGFAHYDLLKLYRKVILVTQGTVERDPEKIIVPTLEAFKDSEFLVIATTGGSQTDALRARYPQANLIIEDFIDFNEIMPYCDVYVTNGGYGGVMQSIQNRLPMVAAGVHEGKNEITARIGYFRLGVNLKTETPTPEQIRMQVTNVLKNPVYRQSIAKLQKEFSAYNPNELCENYIAEVLGESLRPQTVSIQKREPVLV